MGREELMGKYFYFIYNEYTDRVSDKFDSFERAKEEAEGWTDGVNNEEVKILEVSAIFSCEMKPVWKKDE